jgi:putative phosphoesterase
VHGNDVALTAVLDEARAEGVSHLLVAGDVVGYYYQPARCLELLAEWPVTAVRGNHEDLLDESERDAARADALCTKYGSGLRVATATLSTEMRAGMDAWPRTASLDMDGCRITLCHGTPWSTDEYLYPDAPADVWARLAAGGDDLVVFGHTHYRVDRRIADTRIVNPGSVGQPRDGAGGACWATFDTVTRTLMPRVTQYDRDRVAAEARRRDPQLPYLADVLFREAARA